MGDFNLTTIPPVERYPYSFQGNAPQSSPVSDGTVAPQNPQQVLLDPHQAQIESLQEKLMNLSVAHGVLQSEHQNLKADNQDLRAELSQARKDLEILETVVKESCAQLLPVDDFVSFLNKVILMEVSWFSQKSRTVTIPWDDSVDSPGGVNLGGRGVKEVPKKDVATDEWIYLGGDRDAEAAGINMEQRMDVILAQIKKLLFSRFAFIQAQVKLAAADWKKGEETQAGRIPDPVRREAFLAETAFHALNGTKYTPQPGGYIEYALDTGNWAAGHASSAKAIVDPLVWAGLTGMKLVGPTGWLLSTALRLSIVGAQVASKFVI